MPTQQAITGKIPAADIHALLTLVSYARPTRVLELGSNSGHVTADLTEWTDLQTVIVSVCEKWHPEIDHFGKSKKVERWNSLQFEAIAPTLDKFDFVVIHESTNTDRLLIDSRQSYDVLSLGGWLVWMGFTPSKIPSTVHDAIRAASFSEKVFHFAGTRIAYLQKAPPVSRRIKSFAIRWEGDVDVLHSLAAVNRALVDRLQKGGHVVSVSQTHSVPAASMRERHPAHFAITQTFQNTPDAVIRHTWPPILSRSSDDVPVVLIQPWEFVSPPKVWVESLRKGIIAEWWVPSEHTRQGAIQAGVPADRVVVVPNGVDISLFRPEGDTFLLNTRKRFKFLFVGGTIWRKGFDILLKAYAQAFTANDEVCLVVKDSGIASQYQGQTAQESIKKFQLLPGAPELEYHTEDLADTEMAQLYRAVDCLVHPYRGESFGMPIAEAMASSLAVIVTQNGSTDDWCDEQNAFLIPSRQVYIPSGPVSGMETVGNASYLEPDINSLISQLRFVAANPDQVRLKGKLASETVRNRLTWDHATLKIESRLQELHKRRKRKPGHQISLTMIVRNEEPNLDACLGWLNILFDEIIIVDTGSTDRTKEIATSYGVKVYEYVWSDSFADARNQAIHHATGDWIFWLDADERIDENNRRKLKDLFNSLQDEQAAFLMTCHCLSKTGEVENRIDHVRLFRRNDSIRWQYRVHEQILPALQKIGTTFRWSDLIISHVGYSDGNLVEKKHHRDLRLLNLDIAERPGDPLILFQLGIISHKFGQHDEAIRRLNESLSRLQPGDSILPKTYVLLAQCHREIGESVRAMEKIEEGRRLFPEDAELLYLEAILRQEFNDFIAAESCFRQLLTEPNTRHLENVSVGLRSHIGRHGLACLLFQCGRLQEAIGEWKKVLQDSPNFSPAILRLAEAIRINESPANSPRV